MCAFRNNIDIFVSCTVTEKLVVTVVFVKRCEKTLNKLSDVQVQRFVRPDSLAALPSNMFSHDSVRSMLSKGSRNMVTVNFLFVCSVPAGVTFWNKICLNPSQQNKNRARRVFMQSFRDTVFHSSVFPEGLQLRWVCSFSLMLSLQTWHQCRRRGFLIIRGCKEEEVAELTLAKACWGYHPQRKMQVGGAWR